ncbi:MAG: thiamine-phosphate kinase [Flavobacteriales bacterium]
MSEEIGRTELHELGEFGLIKHLTQGILYTHTATVKGVGDDAAILQAPTGLQTVITTDMLLEGIHFDLGYVPLKHLGYKCVAVNVSDVLAMNAQPAHITVGLALSNRFSVEATEELYSGMLAACRHYGIDLVGGDTTSSLSGMVISITAVGYAEPHMIATRSGAREGDLILVSGNLGGAFAGLQVLEREKKVFTEAPGVQPDLGGYEYVLQRQLKPEARQDITTQLKELEIIPTAMIDISDGLASELLHIADGSNVGVDVYEEKIPLHENTLATANDFGLNPITCALNGGEDYELLFTIKQKDYDKAIQLHDVTIIGHVTAEGSESRLITRAGEGIALKAQGWDTFNTNE